MEEWKLKLVIEIKWEEMKGLNRVVLVGNLGKDPEVRKLNGGYVVAKVSVATTEVYRIRNGELYSDTQWHTVVLWGALAGVAEKYLRRGSLVYFEGRLRTRSYEEEGIGRRYITEVIGNRLVMLDRKDSAAGRGESVTAGGIVDEGLPF